MALLNLKFADGNQLVSFEDDSWSSPGCPTCDYGSKYVNEISIVTTNYYIEIVFSQMYEFAFSTADAIKIFAVDIRGMTETEFIGYIDAKVHEFSALNDYRVTKK